MLWATLTCASCSGVVPYSYMWRTKLSPKVWSALAMP